MRLAPFVIICLLAIVSVPSVPADDHRLAVLYRADALPVIDYAPHVVGGKLATFLAFNNYQTSFSNSDFIASNFSTNTEMPL